MHSQLINMHCKHCHQPILELSPILLEELCLPCEELELKAISDYMDVRSYPNTLDDDIDDWPSLKT